jgi:hypothetical protein
MNHYPKGTWRCAYCKEIKPLKFFYTLRRYTRKDGTHPPHPVCIQCGYTYTTGWVKKNKDKYNAYQKAWHRKEYQDPIKRKAILGRSKKWYDAMMADPKKHELYLAKRRARTKLKP